MRGLSALLLGVLLPLLSGCTAAPAYQGEATDNFDGMQFVNSDPMDKSAVDFVRLAWGAVTDSARWPGWVAVTAQPVARERVYTGISVTFINHATFLVQVDGLNILTDPIYSQRASPFQWIGPERVHAPGVALADLPPIDVVLISHNHYDHLDEATLQQLFAQQEEPPLILSGLGNGRLFEQLGLASYRDMDWGETVEIAGTEFVFTECRHRSGRGLGDQMKTLWGSFVVKTRAGNIYFAGDTGYGPHLKDTGDTYGPFVLSLLPIGAYEPRWFMADVHLDPQEAVRAHLDLRSEHSIAMHFGTFQLTYEGINQPTLDLATALEDQGVDPADFDVLLPGHTAMRNADFNVADSQPSGPREGYDRLRRLHRDSAL